MTEWRAVVNDGQEVLTNSDGLYDVRTVKTFNPFGDHAKAYFDDLNGTIFDIFGRGTKLELQYDAPYTSGFETDFVGYVVSEFETEAQGAEQLEVEAYTFDQFLRGNNVSADLSGLRIFDALQQVIEEDVPPVSWNAGLVDIVDNKKLTQSYQGEKVEDFLLDVRAQSSGELFGVTEDLEFFFELPELTRTRVDIDNTDWVTHNINEEGGETKNQVTVFYGGGDRAVTVDDSGDQLNIQDNLGAAGPATQTETITRENITNINDAINAGEAYLNGRASTLTGPVTTTDLIDAQPGEVIGITVEPRGIDGDFRIAENVTRWRGETNELTVVEKKGAEDDILIAQSKTVKRVENRPTDNTVVPDRITDTNVGAVFDVSITADSTTAEITRLTNAGRNAVRDGIINESVLSNFTLQTSTSTARPNRSDTSLDSVVDSTTASVSLSGTTVTYTGSLSGSGIQTIGVIDADSGELLAQGRLADPVSNPTVDLSITVQNDDSTSKSVLTTTGQTLCAEILSGGNPDWPQSYAYGNGTAEPTESDTTLTSQVTTQDLDTQLIQDASERSEFEQIIDIQDTEPLAIEDFSVQLLQSAYTRNTGDFTTNDGTLTTDTNATDETAIELTTDGIVEWPITTQYDIPVGDSTEAYIAIRVRAGGPDPIQVFPSFDGDAIPTVQTYPGTDYEWILNEIEELYGGDAVTAGNHTIGVRTDDIGSSTTDPIYVDRVVLYDDRFDYNFDNVTDANNQLEGPELFPDEFLKDLNTADTQQPVSEASVDTVWSDTSNNQRIDLSNDGTNYTFISNSETGSVTFSTSEFDVDSRINFSRHGSRTNDTPTQGFQGQELFVWQLFSNPESISTDEIGVLKVQAILSRSKATNQTFSEAGLVDSAGDLLTHSLIPEFTKQETQQVVSGERISFSND